MTYAELLQLPEKEFESRVSQLVPALIQDEDLLIQFAKEIIEWERIHNPDQKDFHGREYSEKAKGVINLLTTLDTHESVEMLKKIKKYTEIDLIMESLMAMIATHRVRDADMT